MKKDNDLNHNLKLIVKTSAIVFIGLVLSKLLGYAYRIIIARALGPEIYGLFSLALTVALTFVTFSAFGLSEGLIRFISLYRGNKEIDKILED